MNLESFEDLLNRGRLHYIYKPAHEKIKELHSDDCIGFYAKSLHNNNNDTELFYFYKEVIVQIKFTVDNNSHGYPILITQFNNKIKKKSISMHRTNYEPVELTFDLEDGSSFNFNSANDSNDDWQGEYAENILSIYKFI